MVLLVLLIAAMGIAVRQDLLPIRQPEQPHTEAALQQAPVSPNESLEAGGNQAEQHAERLQHEKALISAGTSSTPPPKTIADKGPAPSRTIVQEPAPLTVTQGKDDEMSVINRKITGIPTAGQLPPSAQANVGKMKFAGHVYSEDTARRMIMINNKILREGDAIDTDFRLQEITRSGVILLYKSAPFRIDLF
jgi:cytoskeletal protein RodZ